MPGGETFPKRWIDLIVFIQEIGQHEGDLNSVVRDLPLASLRGAFWKDLGPPGYLKEFDS